MQFHSHRFSVAPMMDWTDRHDRYFLRLISRQVRLYTEMLTAEAVIHGDRDRLLGFSVQEHPVALQLGGADPARMELAAEIGAAAGYDEININVGCPSDRVQSGAFGACLMADPGLVSRIWEAMQARVAVPVTVKSRIGIDDWPNYAAFRRFAAVLFQAGLHTLIVHARKAMLNGLSPKENREIPPLHYDYVYRLKQEFPERTIVVNGGIDSLDAVAAHLLQADGVMLGRAAYHNPYMLSDVDQRFFGCPDLPQSRSDVVSGYLAYMDDMLVRGAKLHHLTRHILGLYHGQPGARTWRRLITVGAARPNAGPEVVRAALVAVEQAAADLAGRRRIYAAES